MFSKKIIVLKQTAEDYSVGNKPASGICRLEKENAVLTVYLSMIGFASLSAGEYRLYIVGDDKTVLSKELGKIPASITFSLQNDLNLNKGISAGIWTVKDDLPLLVAYQKSEDACLSAKDYGSEVVNAIIADRKLREREKEFEIPQPTITPTSLYNDEAVATENYYDLNEEIQRKLINIEEFSNEHLRPETNDGDNDIAQENGESQKDFNSIENETDDNSGENSPYYLTVKEEIDGLFAKYPEERELEKAFWDAKFVKVYYSEDKFYVVGVVKENGKEKYICYGVPSPYRASPPKELAGYCSFVPLSIFDLKGDGYFMMFQDAVTGKCVHKG